ncbi:MAG: hypothetical protein M1818_006647 [Claussenomyces sp. TS43310]|nr:MAG: hypothetical protein M1818_006920 [Claussenomyces sp. TS43310]KAI9735070.1 MAG: hypothetical protein M1818_006647 [Claussenomyces sp. TS43310]
MAAHYRDDILHGRDHTDPHADPGRWRHQESTAFARHAAPKPRHADERGGVTDLADFLNSSRVEPHEIESRAVEQRYKPISADSPSNGNDFNENVQFITTIDGANNLQPGTGDRVGGTQNKTAVGLDGPSGETMMRGTDGREVRCGPLLNYRRMEKDTWFGSVLIVTRGGGAAEGNFKPELLLKKLGESLQNSQTDNGVSPLQNGFSEGQNVPGIATYHDANDSKAANHNGILNGVSNDGFPNGISSGSVTDETRTPGVRLYSDSRNTFWRFNLRVDMESAETHWAYHIPGLRFPESKKTDYQSFFVPASKESMRIMFHSCNGFSVGTDESAWSGPCLWNDVLRVHQSAPFHVMLGGGDQIYNDGIRVHGPLRAWTDIANPSKRRDYPFPETLRKECDDYYVENYIRWYSTEPFASANGQIPQLNLWDDHDIIDGFGSYTDHFMKCAVFRGIGGLAHKYYLLFQHHLTPPRSTYTSDAPQSKEVGLDGLGLPSEQLENTYVLENELGDPGYIIGPKPGPYVAEHSRSIYARLGARIAFFGLDARTERTRHQVNYPETYELIFSRLKAELSTAASSSSPIQHLIVLLGIPIAYPRLTWLENIFSSPVLGPIKFLHRRMGFGGGFFNHFDGNVDLLDDLDDHYTAKTHKRERYELVLRLQELAASFSVRVTILGGDVHLAALGRFYSNPKLGLPVTTDHRYMANVISSAIVNKPPPAAVANLLARRNKIHHLDENTDETLLKLFDKDPGKDQKTAQHNHVTMPSRNWAMLTENSIMTTRAPSTNGHGHANNEHVEADLCTSRDGHFPLGPGESPAGTENRAANGKHGTAGDGSLDVCIRVEKDRHDPQGQTQSYGMWVPTLRTSPDMAHKVMRKRDAIQGTIASRT